MLTYVHLHSIKHFLPLQDKYGNVKDDLPLRITTDQRVKVSGSRGLVLSSLFPQKMAV